MTVSSKIRIYDLAKELKLDTKRLIEEVRREGVDVSVPSNSVSKELAEKIRNKYFPKKETAVKRGVRVVKRAERTIEEPPAPEVTEPAPEPEVPLVAEAPEAEPVSAPPPAVEPAKPAAPARVIRKLSPAARAELPPEAEVVAAPEETPIEAEAPAEMPVEAVAPETAGANGTPAETVKPVAPPSRQVRVLRPTVAALNAGIRLGDRAPSPVAPPPPTPRERVDRTTGARVRERTPLARTERHGTPGETATPQTTYIPPPDAGRRRSRRAPTRGGRKVEGKGGRFDKGDVIPPP